MACIDFYYFSFLAHDWSLQKRPFVIFSLVNRFEIVTCQILDNTRFFSAKWTGGFSLVSLTLMGCISMGVSCNLGVGSISYYWNIIMSNVSDM